MASSLVGGVDLSDNGLAFDALLDNPPGQHFLGNAHTLANFENAFWRSNRRQQQLRAMAGGRIPRSRREGARNLARCWPSTSRRPWTRRRRRSCRVDAQRKASFPGLGCVSLVAA